MSRSSINAVDTTLKYVLSIVKKRKDNFASFSENHKSIISSHLKTIEIINKRSWITNLLIVINKKRNCQVVSDRVNDLFLSSKQLVDKTNCFVKKYFDLMNTDVSDDAIKEMEQNDIICKHNPELLMKTCERMNTKYSHNENNK